MIHGPPGSSRWADFFCLWLVMWSNPIREISSIRKSAKSKKKSAAFKRKQRILLSCRADLNRRPHPYQLIANPRSTVFRCFGGLFVPGNRRQWCFLLHCLRPLVSYCGSTCGSAALNFSPVLRLTILPEVKPPAGFPLHALQNDLRHSSASFHIKDHMGNILTEIDYSGNELLGIRDNIPF